MYCCSSEEFDWENKIPVGIIEDEKFYSKFFSFNELYYKAIKYAGRDIERKEKQVKEVHSHFFEEGWSVPITHLRGEVVLVLREGKYVYFVSGPIHYGEV